jgi:hypothetical protein
MKDSGYTYKFLWIIIFFNGPFEYGDGGIYRLLRWIQNVHQSADHKILCSDRSLEDEQLLLRSLLWESKNVNMAGGWKLKLTFYFMERTHEPLHLDKLSFVCWKTMDIPTRFIWIISFFDGSSEYGGISKLWGYVRINAELLCVEFCSFLQCHISVSYLSYCFNRGVLNIRDNDTAAKKYSRLKLIYI